MLNNILVNIPNKLEVEQFLFCTLRALISKKKGCIHVPNQMSMASSFNFQPPRREKIQTERMWRSPCSSASSWSSESLQLLAPQMYVLFKHIIICGFNLNNSRCDRFASEAKRTKLLIQTTLYADKHVIMRKLLLAPPSYRYPHTLIASCRTYNIFIVAESNQTNLLSLKKRANSIGLIITLLFCSHRSPFFSVGDLHFIVIFAVIVFVQQPKIHWPY